ncbi:MAG: hypothetical protein JXQ67_10050 [Campylobacterales bacterium]|nr:hypothetical protein [Campylobacterales bacterium]
MNTKEILGASAVSEEIILSTCVHCSAGCPLEYKSILSDSSVSSFEVRNLRAYAASCEAGLHGFAFANTSKQSDSFLENLVDVFKNATAIRFNSMITNEELFILAQIKEQYGVKLYNEEARVFSVFNEQLGVYDKRASLDDVANADGIIVLGGRIRNENPALAFAISNAVENYDAKAVYAHPIEDAVMSSVFAQFMKYEAGTEEGVVALLASELLQNSELSEADREYFEELDTGYLEAESNVGDDELNDMSNLLSNANKIVLVLGSDLFAHPRAINIAKLIAKIAQYKKITLFVEASQINTLGVSKIVTLDTDEGEDDVIGYNTQGGFFLSSCCKEADFSLPALTQLNGTVITVENKVVKLNAIYNYEGYSLRDIALALGLSVESTKSTEELTLQSVTNMDSSLELEDVDDLPEYNGTIIYASNPEGQFNICTNKVSALQNNRSLRGSAQFALAAKVANGDTVDINVGKSVIRRVFELDETLKGTIALNPTFDMNTDGGIYKFLKSKIVRVS